MGATDGKDAAWPRRRLALPFYYGWVNLAIAALAMTATLPGRTHGLGLITEPLLHDLPLDDHAYSTLNFWAILIGAAFCWPTGRLLDRWGSRTVLTGTALALGTVVILMSRCDGVPGLLVSLILVRGLGQGALSIVSMAIVGKWFARRLGPAMGVFAVLLAIGFIAGTLGLGAAIQELGWRQAWAGLGWALMLGLAPLSWLFVRSTPQACGPALDELRGDPQHGNGEADMSLAAALRAPAFWMFSLTTSLFGLVWSAITLYNQKILESHGFDARTYYLVMALLTASGLATNLLGGWLAQRWPIGRLLALGVVLFATALAVFPGIRTFPQVVLYSLALGAAGGLITVVHFTFYGHAFGRAHLGQIQGAAQVLSVFASALGPWMLTLCLGSTGSYDGLFLGAALAAGVLGLGAWLTPLPRRGQTITPRQEIVPESVQT